MGFTNPITTLSADQITAGQLADDVIAHALAAGVVTETAIAAGAITADKIAAKTLDGVTVISRQPGTGWQVYLKDGHLQFADDLGVVQGELLASGGTLMTAPASTSAFVVNGGSLGADKLFVPDHPRIIKGTVTLTTPTTVMQTKAGVSYGGENFGTKPPLILPAHAIDSSGRVLWCYGVSPGATTFTMRYKADAAWGVDATVTWVGLVFP